MSLVSVAGAKKERTLLSVGVTSTLLGLAFSVGGASAISRSLTLAGLVVLILGLHRFGRSGPDAPHQRGRKQTAGRRKVRGPKPSDD